jgi:hypothetical protein
MSLKPCPCGNVPTEIVVVKSGYKWSRAVPNCCGEWMYEFRVDGATGPKHFELTHAAWNNMPRGDNAQQEETK